MLPETRCKLKAVMILAMVSAAEGTRIKTGIRLADANSENPLGLEELQKVKTKRPSLLQVDQESGEGNVKYIPTMLRPPRRTAAPAAPSLVREKDMPTLSMAALPARPARSAVRSGQPNMGLFGLGAPELGVIGVALLFVLGPDKLKDMAKDLGKIAADLKEVPEEFNKGMVEEAEKRKADKTVALTEAPASTEVVTSTKVVTETPA